MIPDYFILPILFRSRARLDALCKFVIACFTFSACPLVTALKNQRIEVLQCPLKLRSRTRKPCEFIGEGGSGFNWQTLAGHRL